jgi:ClpP class serine protease
VLLWLLEPSTLARLHEAQQTFRDTEAVVRWQTEQAAAESAAAGSDGLPKGLSMHNGTATIRVEGVLTKRPDFWAQFFGGSNTTYSSIANALRFAASSADVSEIVFSIDSPGGNAEGLIELLEMIGTTRQQSGKKMRVLADQAQSAAYGIAAAVGPITARHRGAPFGSVGTATSYYLDPRVVDLTNTDSPDKRPNLATDEGKAVVVRYLDQINHEFASAIAGGRGVPLERVTKGYGRGASMTAAEALRLGLIDNIQTTPPRAVPNNQGKAMAERNPEETERAARAAAVQEGVTQERDRILGHLTMGEACGDMSIALAAIRSGETMTATLSAQYMAAGMRRAAQGQRQAESNTAETQLANVGAGTPAAAGASPVTATGDLGDQVVAVLQGKADKGFVRG